MKKISIVFSCYNEEKCLDKLFEKINTTLNNKYNYELIFINDGSKDKTRDKILEFKKNNKSKKNVVKLISFSKNFGHEASMLCGLDYATGECIIFMDSDLQHPLEKVDEIINEIENGTNIVSMISISNSDQSNIGRTFSTLFYKLINKISNITLYENASDFFAIDNTVAEYLRNNYREKVRFLRGIVQNIGFNKKALYFVAGSRTSGRSHYNLFSLIRLAFNTIFSYTNLPLHLGGIFAVFSALLGFILMIYTLITRGSAPSGYATIIIFLCFMFSIMFLIIGIIGEYIAIIFTEIKNRPSYTIMNIE